MSTSSREPRPDAAQARRRLRPKEMSPWVGAYLVNVSAPLVHPYGDARTVASRLGPSAAQAAAQTAVMYTHSTHSPKGPLACMVGSVRLTAPVSKLARRKTPSRWRFNAPKRSGAGAGQTRLVARQMHSTKRVCGEQAQRLGARACSWARALCAPARRPRASRPGCTAVATPAAPRRRQ